MKTDISIPNPIFEAATKLAQKLDMSLSELYTAALAACRRERFYWQKHSIYPCYWGKFQTNHVFYPKKRA